MYERRLGRKRLMVVCSFAKEPVKLGWPKRMSWHEVEAGVVQLQGQYFEGVDAETL